MTACLVPTIDGAMVTYTPPASGCCPPSLCDLDPCAFVCSFLAYLPSGPLWDTAKAGVITSGGNPCEAECDEPCQTTLVNHAVYTAKRLFDALFDALWPALRESSPYTAWDSRDDWLRRLGWVDCFGEACRSDELGDLTPLEVMGVKRCEVWSPTKQMIGDGFTEGPMYCPPTFPPELVDAVKRGTLIALARLQHGIIPNVANINYIISELGAELIAVEAPPSTEPPCPVVDPVFEMEGSEPCNRRNVSVAYKLCPTGQTIRAAKKPECPKTTPLSPPAISTTACSEFQCDFVQAFYEPTCNDPAGLPTQIWPGLLAAECIVRAMIPDSVRLTLIRCC